MTPLTPRQSEIARLLVLRRARTIEVAFAVRVSQRTVAREVEGLYRRFHVRDRVGLLAALLRAGIIELDEVES